MRPHPSLSFGLPALLPTALLLASLTACAPPAPVAQTAEPTIYRVAAQPGGPDLSPDGLQSFMFGPPPRTRVEPVVRCWVKCPESQAGLASNTPVPR